MGALPKPEAVEPETSSEGHLRLVIDTIPALALTAQPDGSVNFINRRWLEFTGLKMEELRGWGWRAAIHPEEL